MYDKSPAKNLNKGYGSEMESPKQERKNLMKDMPIDRTASGSRGGSWMSKHSQSKMGGSPLMAAKPDYIDIDGDGNKSESMKSAAKGSPGMMVSPLNGSVGDALSKGKKAIGRGIKKLSNTTLGDIAEGSVKIAKNNLLAGVPAIKAVTQKYKKKK